MMEGEGVNHKFTGITVKEGRNMSRCLSSGARFENIDLKLNYFLGRTSVCFQTIFLKPG